MQYVQVFIIEANPRASRTVPFVAKAIGHPIASYASLLMSGQTLADIGFTKEEQLKHVAVKEAVLPFEKFPGMVMRCSSQTIQLCSSWLAWPCRHGMPSAVPNAASLLAWCTCNAVTHVPRASKRPTSLHMMREC